MESSMEGITAVRAAGINNLPLSFIYSGMVEFDNTFIVSMSALDTIPVNRGEEIIYELFFRAKFRNFFELDITLLDQTSYSMYD